jgi:hypothetical protein
MVLMEQIQVGFMLFLADFVVRMAPFLLLITLDIGGVLRLVIMKMHGDVI